MTVPAAGQAKKEYQEDNSTRRALIVASIIAGLLILLSVASWFVFLSAGRALAVLVPMTAIVVVVVGILLIQQNQIVIGVSLPGKAERLHLRSSTCYAVTGCGTTGGHWRETWR